MNGAIKRVAAWLPERWQLGVKRWMFARQIRRGVFAPETEDLRLVEPLLALGDWVIDVGANVGHYTKRFSDKVGNTGRVVALEPVPLTFDLLTSNVSRFAVQNVTLLGVAASDRCRLAGMHVPSWDTGLRNYYRAALDDSGGGVSVLTVVLDELGFTHPIRLIKIDAEGHDAAVISGLKNTIERDLPILILETVDAPVLTALKHLGYEEKKAQGTANTIFLPPA